ncbi:hypothetical protein [Pleionea sp. CnH1-48]|uniref:hypothetical protein n=1 Tax=Pleionea sp. CnH1-48 TaxID=2954494 RepID=UPI0020980071|nr:hypothetical protein [Pleionea sp. CnH1-48]MCO7223827.1 hypothetical protein [Pleionea sp. CnH1-48]
MKSGFGFLKNRPLDNPVDFQTIEQALGLALPSLYRLFAQSFILEEDQLALDYYYDSEIEMPFALSSIEYGPGDIPGNSELNILDFYSLEKILFLWKGVEEKEDLWQDKRLLKIGMCAIPADGGIYLGVGPDNQDEIWRVSWDWGGEGEPCAKIAENIFEFVRGFETSAGDELKKQYKEKVSMNWGDTYWTINGDIRQ